MLAGMNIDHMVKYAGDLSKTAQQEFAEKSRKHLDAAERIREELRTRVNENIHSGLESGAPRLSFSAVRDGESVAQLEKRLERERVQKLSAWKYGKPPTETIPKRNMRNADRNPTPGASRLTTSRNAEARGHFSKVIFQAEKTEEIVNPQRITGKKLMVGNYLHTPREPKVPDDIGNLVLTQSGVVESKRDTTKESLNRSCNKVATRPNQSSKKRSRPIVHHRTTSRQISRNVSTKAATTTSTPRAILNDALEKDKEYSTWPNEVDRYESKEADDIGFAIESHSTSEPHGLSFDRGEVIRILTRNAVHVAGVDFDHGESLLTKQIGVFPSHKLAPYTPDRYQQPIAQSSRNQFPGCNFDARIGQDVELYDVNDYGNPEWFPVRVVGRRETIMFDVICKETGEKLEGVNQLQLRHIGEQDPMSVAPSNSTIITPSHSFLDCDDIRKHDSAAKLQSLYRGKASRETVQQMQRETEAAKRIQCISRGNAIRRNQQREEETQAAIRIQSTIRARNAATMQVKTPHRASIQEKELLIRMEDNKAASAIQAVHRGKLARQRLAEQQAAARKLQRILMKNSSQRRHFAPVPHTNMHGCGETELSLSPNIDDGISFDAEQQLAIAKIQAVQRGRAARARQRQYTSNMSLSIDEHPDLYGESHHVAARQIQAVRRAQLASSNRDIVAASSMASPEMEAAASRIQAIQRGRKERFNLQTVNEEQSCAAQKIQALRRGKQARRQVQEEKQAATKIQKLFGNRRNNKDTHLPKSLVANVVHGAISAAIRRSCESASVARVAKEFAQTAVVSSLKNLCTV